jgi:hypothetical protein
MATGYNRKRRYRMQAILYDGSAAEQLAYMFTEQEKHAPL